MAGYLGTLFMANVGMRLVLPSKSEYNRASQNFGSMVANITQKQKAYFNAASRGNVTSLRKTMQANQKLAEDYSKKQSEGVIRRLQKNLNQIRRLTKGSISGIAGGASYAGKSVTRLSGLVSRMPSAPGAGASDAAKKTFAAKYAQDLKAVEVELRKLEIAQAAANRQFIKGGEAIQSVANYMIGTFRSALATSVTLLTTVSYTIKGLAADFTTFERELINANSIWQETNETLYEISDRVIKFGEEYGIAYDNASRVLYQFASAGLEAAEAQAVLNDVLILSMAVQGDANTIGKLTVQTIKGFGMEMSDAGVLTDKFAHAINASLIEYQDLASAIKFALPFFAATNQNVDQLLGSIQILTDRALEAGIAGRGLRQALAEFAEGAEDATRKFSEMGVKVVDAQGNFLQMTEIARNFADAIGTDIANDTELLTALIDDLNIRGATAFIHLVQNVDEFEQAVSELAGSQGAAAKMADIQQNSLAMLTQKMRNAMKEVFFLSDAQYVANGYMNQFDKELKDLILDFTELFIVELPDGTKNLTQFSYDLRDTVLVTLQGFGELMEGLVKKLVSMTQQGFRLTDMARTLFYPLQVIETTLSGIDWILGPFGEMGTGLIFKFGALSMMFGTTAAAAIILGDAIAALLNKVEAIGDSVGFIIMLASLVYTGGGSALAMRGAGAASMRGAGTLGTKGVFKGKKYAGSVDDLLAKKGWRGGLDKTDEAFGTVVDPNIIAGKAGTGYRSLGSFQRESARHNLLRKGQQNILDYGAPSPIARYYAQSARHYKPTQLGYDMRAGLLQHADDYARAEGMRRMKWGAVGTYAGYKSWRYDGSQSFASSAMRAQMDSSSYQSGGGAQDLYINNAYVESNNFKDLFYSSNELGG